MESRKIGRPKKGEPAPGQTPLRSLRASDEEWALYRSAADTQGQDLSAWIRATLTRAARLLLAKR